jgi:hypothetical protein
MAPLEDLKLTSRNKKFEFQQQHRTAFDRCVELIKAGTMLNRPKGDGLFIVEVDACKKTYTVSATFKQQQEGDEKILAYGSKRLNQVDKEKGIPFLEFSAIHYGATHFQDVIRGRKLVIRSDHESLERLHLQDPKGKWLTMLGEIVETKGEVEYLPGSENRSSDMQTRLWRGENTKEDEEVENSKNVVGFLQSLQPQVVEDRDLQEKIVEKYHHHFSDRKTVQNIKKKYVWKDGGEYESARVFRETKCDYCLKNRMRGEKRGLMQTTQDPLDVKACWQLVGIDVWPQIEISEGRRRHAGIAVCGLSGSLKLFGLPDLTASKFVEKFEKRMESEGNPEYIVGDSAAQFLGEAMKQMTTKMGAEFLPSKSYRHQGNAIVENKTKTAKSLLHSKLKDGVSWKKALREVERILNQELVSDSTGFTPFEIEKGRLFDSGFDRAVREEIENRKKLQEKAIINKEFARERQEYYYNKGKKERAFKEGDVVMIRDNQKSKWLQDFRKGPFVVEKRLERDDYLLTDRGRQRWFRENVENMELCRLDHVKEFEKKEKERLEKEKAGSAKSSNEKQQHELTIGKRVLVWFGDKRKDFRGTIVDILGEEKYEVEWDNKSQKNEVVELRARNMTREKTNEDRWVLMK